MKKKLEPLRELSVEELQKKADNLRVQLLALPDAEKSKAKPIKREIARILSIIREKTVGGV